MQNWKLIDNSAPTIKSDGLSRVADIADRGFASFSHPKLKFNFTVDIDFRVPISGLSSSVGHASMREIDIPVKTATRPNPSVTYTDVNYYNYRTKVATKTEYGTCSISFYDDANDKAQNVYKTYLNYISPVSSLTDMQLLSNPETVPFGQLSSLGPLPENSKSGIIRTLKLHHYYKDRSLLKRTTYTYLNPKINSFQLDDLNMSESDVNTITMEFNYDGVTTTTVVVA